MGILWRWPRLGLRFWHFERWSFDGRRRYAFGPIVVTFPDGRP